MFETNNSIIARELKCSVHNYSPLPVALQKGLAVKVWDIQGNMYFYFLSAYSAVNQRHCHPKITQALTEQTSNLTLVSIGHTGVATFD